MSNNVTETKRRVAYENGEGSRCISHDKSRNPYQPGTIYYDDWLDGWENQDKILNGEDNADERD